MGNKEIKALFLQADEQIPVNEIRKQETYEALTAEMDKQDIPVMSRKRILLSQLWYMDKIFFAFYGVLICLGVIFVLILQHMGAGKNEIIIACMIGAGILSVVSVLLIEKLFFRGMAELGASCYFNTKQCVAAYLLLAGVINLAILFLITAYVGCYWKVGLLQTGLYVLTPYFVSSMTALGIMSAETRGRTPYLPGICAAFLSIGYAVLSSVPGAFLTTSLWVWGIVCVTAGILFLMQLKKLFRQIEKGEVLCMN